MAKASIRAVPTAPKELDLFQEARDYYVNMQKSWFEFARALFNIREAYNSGGELVKPLLAYAGDFKEYLAKDFPGIDYDYARKMCDVIENFGGEIQKRIEKDDKYKIPAMWSCYLLVGSKSKKVPDFSDLKKKVLESKITFALLKEKISRAEKTVIEKLEKEIDDEVAAVEEEAANIVDIDENEELEEPTEEQVATEDLWDSVKSIHKNVTILNDNIPAVMDMIVAHGKKDPRLNKLFNDALDLYETGLTNLMDAIDNLGGKK